MPKERKDALNSAREKGERKITRTAKSKIKKLHTATKVLAVLFLIVGIAAGVLVCNLLSKNDRFVLTGNTQISIEAGTAYTYEEEGFEAVAFGMDCSAKVQIEASKGITVNADNTYTISTEPGVYTLTYTVNNLKFNGKLGGEQIRRIRVFTVDAIEDTDRFEEDNSNG